MQTMNQTAAFPIIFHIASVGYSPGKQSFKVKLLSRMVFNDRCSVFASYQAHFRESFLEHQAALGVSVSF